MDSANAQENEEMKMNSKFLIVMLVLVSMLLVGCSSKTKPGTASTKASTKTEKIDQMTKGNQGWRTWIIYKTDTPDQKHMTPGDAFRLKKTGDGYRLQPLNVLKGRWEKADGFTIKMTVANGAQPILCGVVVVPGHSAVEESHYILVKWISDDFIEVTYEREDDAVPDQCVTRSTHGGRAHAQN
jgi:hypothetical protein